MKKKQYIQPETIIVEVKHENLLFKTSVEYGGEDPGDLPIESKKGFFEEEEPDMDETAQQGSYWDVVGTN